MKKILYTLATIALLASCAQERGTTTEVADANEDEKVNPSHLRGYHMPGTTGQSTASISDGTNQTGGTTTTQGNKSAVDLVYAYYTKNDPASFYRAQNYKFSSTKRMAGSAPDTATTKTENRATTIAPQSTNADAQGRKSTTKKQSSDSKSKTRLTPDESKKQR